VFLENRSNAPIADLSLRLEYASRYLLRDGTRIADPKHNAHAVLTIDPDARREARELLGKALVSVDVGVLRPHDTALVCEFFSIPAPDDAEKSEDPSADPRILTATRRLSPLPAFRAFFVLDVVARSSNCPPLALTINVLLGTAPTCEALGDLAGACASEAWDGLQPRPGLYVDAIRVFRRPRLRSVLRQELTWLLFLGTPATADVADPKAVVDRSLSAEVAPGVLTLPPWGFTGEAFDPKPYLGIRMPTWRELRGRLSRPTWRRTRVSARRWK
jgi:hypothetical protein